MRSSDCHISISLFIQRVNHFSCFLKYKTILHRSVRNFLTKLHAVRNKHVSTYIRATVYKTYSIIQTLIQLKVAVKMQLNGREFLFVFNVWMNSSLRTLEWFSSTASCFFFFLNETFVPLLMFTRIMWSIFYTSDMLAYKLEF